MVGYTFIFNDLVDQQRYFKKERGLCFHEFVY